MRFHPQRILRAALCTLMILVLTAGSASAATRYSTLEFGSRGSEVLQLQKALLALGYDPSGTDGKFGRGTESAVTAYQAAKGLVADGKAGTLTLTQLYAEYAAQSASATTGAAAEKLAH